MSRSEYGILNIVSAINSKPEPGICLYGDSLRGPDVLKPTENPKLTRVVRRKIIGAKQVTEARTV